MAPPPPPRRAAPSHFPPSNPPAASLPDLLEAPTFAPPPPPPPPPLPSAILAAWSALRKPSSPSSSILSSLHTLHHHRHSLRLSSPHLSLLLPLLPLHPHPTSSLLISSALILSPHLLTPSLSSSLLPLLPSLPPSHRLLLLGSLTSIKSHTLGASELLARVLEDFENGVGGCGDLDHLALAGIGYALSGGTDEPRFRGVLGSLLRICCRNRSVETGIRVLKLVEWLILGFVESRAMGRLRALLEETSPHKCETEKYALFTVAMAACGALRAMRVAAARHWVEFDAQLRETLERTIQFVAEQAVCRERGDDDRRVLVSCVALGLTRCGPVAFNGSVIRCACNSLLEEALPLPDLLRMSAQSPEGDSAAVAKNRISEHQDGVLFKEAGPVTGVLCNQYSYADIESRVHVETRMWMYAQELYLHLRAAVVLHRGKRNDLLAEMEKITEAAFLMVVVFAAEVAKHRLDAKSPEGFHPEVAVRILVAFSCVEHLRRMRLPEYTDAVRRAVLVNQENAALSALFVESMPSYGEVTSKPGPLIFDEERYLWHKDEVQTSRILFYLRVIPTCISLVPASMFQEKLASTMFLYMQHPNEKVTRASHSVMVSFLSSGNDTDQEERTALKEKLAFYYMKRSLEAYPGVSPFEGLASGVAALVRHLPAGSPAILFCIHSLVVKARDLCRSAESQDAAVWKSWEGSTEPCKKISDLSLRLIFLVDIQSFPYLLKDLAEFISELPKEGQDVLLDDMHAHVAESDDVTRKPVLVSWLQSLSYISSQARQHPHQKPSNLHCNTDAVANSAVCDELSFNRTLARL